MFILNNIHDRQHGKIYPKEEGQKSAIFDISLDQVNKATNAEWKDLRVGSVVCVVLSTLKMSTIYKVDEIEDLEDEEGKFFLVRGGVVAKFESEAGYTELLNRHNVDHPRLKKNKFGIGFNICNLGEQLDSAPIKSKVKSMTVSELKAAVNM